MRQKFFVRFSVAWSLVGFLFLSSSFLVPSLQLHAQPGRVETLHAVDGLPPETCNVFRDPSGWQQIPSGTHFVFDRRDHAVYSVPASRRGPVKVVEVGGEGGKLLEPSAFDVAPDGMFAVADAPRGQERLQVFDATGKWVAGFFLPGRAQIRVSVSGLAMGGVSTLAFLGNGIALNHPETGSLITEYGFRGTPVRSIGVLRATGHESDRQLHFAMNTGIPIPHPDGGYYFVFVAGTPMFRRYDARGALVFERVIQGRELDPIVESMPRKWPRRTVYGTELPLVVPNVRTAAVDREGNLWVSFLTPFTYVFDAAGDKIRTVQFRAAGIITPSSVSFSPKGTVLVTPGCYEFPSR
jgi:hypothetical protein